MLRANNYTRFRRLDIEYRILMDGNTPVEGELIGISILYSIQNQASRASPTRGRKVESVLLSCISELDLNPTKEPSGSGYR